MPLFKPVLRSYLCKQPVVLLDGGQLLLLLFGAVAAVAEQLLLVPLLAMATGKEGAARRALGLEALCAWLPGYSGFASIPLLAPVHDPEQTVS